MVSGVAVSGLEGHSATFVQKHVIRLLSCALTALVFKVNKAANLVIGTIAAAGSLVSFGSSMWLNNQAAKRFQILPILDVILWGIRHVIHPN